LDASLSFVAFNENPRRRATQDTASLQGCNKRKDKAIRSAACLLSCVHDDLYCGSVDRRLSMRGAMNRFIAGPKKKFPAGSHA
jgi:hypothetical protein